MHDDNLISSSDYLVNVIITEQKMTILFLQISNYSTLILKAILYKHVYIDDIFINIYSIIYIYNISVIQFLYVGKRQHLEIPGQWKLGRT